MRSRKNGTVSAHQVQAHAQHLVEDILGTGSLQATELVNIILTAAAFAISIFAACLRLQTLSDQTARTALRTRLPKRRVGLEKKLNTALQYSVSRSTRRRRRAIACDLHEIPYHGTAAKNHLRGNKARSGTTQFFVYATACIVDHGHRYTLACTWVQKSDTMVDVLERLLDSIVQSGVPIRRLLLDRGFFSNNVLAYLRGRNVPFLMPMMVRGRKPAKGKVATGWRTFLGKKAGWHQHLLQVDDETIRINVCVGYKSYRHHRTGRRKNKKLVFVAAGTRETPRRICAEYRRRFGIEASYRQLGQARIRTSTRDPILRLFFVGLALVLRNLWAWLQGMLFGEKPSPRKTAAAKRRTLRELLIRLIAGIDQSDAFEPLLT